jgi:hypothetical protein
MAFPYPTSCAGCQGPLCLTGHEVRCETCGQLQEGHPLALEAPAASPPSSHVLPGHEFGHTHGDRILNLEKQVAALTAKLATLPTKKGA